MVETDWETAGRAVPVNRLEKRTLRKLNLYLSLALHRVPGMCHKAFSSDTQLPLTFSSCLFIKLSCSVSHKTPGYHGTLIQIRQTFPGTGSSLLLKGAQFFGWTAFVPRKHFLLSSLLLKAPPIFKDHYPVLNFFLSRPKKYSFPILKTVPMSLLWCNYFQFVTSWTQHSFGKQGVSSH